MENTHCSIPEIVKSDSRKCETPGQNIMVKFCEVAVFSSVFKDVSYFWCVCSSPPTPPPPPHIDLM